MSNVEQKKRNRTCKFALGSVGHWAIKTTSECPYAYPVMGDLKQGHFYAVEKVQCKDCEFYVQDEEKAKAYREVLSKYDHRRKKVVKGQKTEYTW